MGKEPANLSKTKKVVYILIALVAVLVVALVVVLAAVVPSNKADDYVVQIWQPRTVSGEPEALIAFGIVVDDGNHVLTVLDYEEYTPDKLLVISPEYGTFNASIQAIDYRTSATLLQLHDANLPVAEIGNISSLALNESQRVYIRGWGSGTNEHMKCPADAYTWDDVSQSFFRVALAGEVISKGKGWVSKSGAVITDKHGKAIGLLGRYWSMLAVVYIPVGYLPLAININSALELLTDTSHTNGPAMLVVLTDQPSVGTYFVPGDPPHLLANSTENLVTDVTGLLGALGERLPLDDLAQYSSDLPLGFYPEEGNMLIAAFTYAVELRDSDNNSLATAKWIGIQWDRSEAKPNRLIYGSTAYAVEGAYSIEGDVSGLVQLIEPVLSELEH